MFEMDEEREILRGPLSLKAAFRLFVVGPISAADIGKMIKMLELQKQFLAGDPPASNDAADQ